MVCSSPMLAPKVYYLIVPNREGKERKPLGALPWAVGG